jgi:hypothetical protein
VLWAISIIPWSGATLFLFPLHATFFNGSNGCGKGVLFFVGLPFFISGGFYFVGLSFASCVDSFCVLPLTTWGSFPFIALSFFVVVTFSWVWMPLFPYGVFFSLFGVPFSLIGIPLCISVGTCFDAIRPKDASKWHASFWG